MRTAIYISAAVLWTYAIIENFQLWYLGAIPLTICVVEIWYDNIIKQLAKQYRKEKDIEYARHENND